MTYRENNRGPMEKVMWEPEGEVIQITSSGGYVNF